MFFKCHLPTLYSKFNFVHSFVFEQMFLVGYFISKITSKIYRLVSFHSKHGGNCFKTHFGSTVASSCVSFSSKHMRHMWNLFHDNLHIDENLLLIVNNTKSKNLSLKGLYYLVLLYFCFNLFKQFIKIQWYVSYMW